MYTATALAVSTGFLGYLQRPAVATSPIPTCVCRCIGRVEEAEGFALSSSDSKFGRDIHQPALSSSFDLSLSGVLLGFLLGVTFAIAVAKFWNCLITALSQALEPQPSLRRPRALAP